MTIVQSNINLWQIVTLSSLFLLSSCEYPIETKVSKSDCIQSILTQLGMKLYSGQVIRPCQTVLYQHEYKDNYFFNNANECARYSYHLYDCSGKNICIENPTLCDAIYKNSNSKIIGIGQ
ncbi:MAG: hypothetical protein ABI851_02310 [Saprospiraceae bacterium]